MKNNYEKYIAHCIEIARRGEYFVAPNPMVGAVLTAPSDSPVEGERRREGTKSCCLKDETKMQNVKPAFNAGTMDKGRSGIEFRGKRQSKKKETLKKRQSNQLS